MTLAILERRANVQQGHTTFGQQLPRLVNVDRIEACSVGNVCLDQAVDLGQPGRSQIAQSAPELEDFRSIESIGNLKSALSRLNEPALRSTCRGAEARTLKSSMPHLLPSTIQTNC
jgi:hypothetical protein